MSSGWPPEEDDRRWEPVRHPSVVGAAHDFRDAARGYSGYAGYAREEGANGGREHREYEAPGYEAHGYEAQGYDGASGYDAVPGYDGAGWNAPAPRSADGSGGYALSHLDHSGEPGNSGAGSYDAGAYEAGTYEAGSYEAPAGADGYGANGYGEPAEGGYYGQIGYPGTGQDEPGQAGRDQSGQDQAGHGQSGQDQAGRPDEDHGQQGYVDLNGAPVYEDAGYGNTGYDATLYAEPRYDDAGYQGHEYDGGSYPGQEFGGEGHSGYEGGAQDGYGGSGHNGYEAGRNGYDRGGHNGYEAGGAYDDGGEAGYGPGGEAGYGPGGETGYGPGGEAGYGPGGEAGYGQDQQAGYGEDQGQGYQDAAYGQAGYAPGYGSGEYAAQGDGYAQGFQHNAAYGRGGYVADGVGYADAGYATSYEPQGYDHRDYGDPRYDDPGYGDPGYEDAQYSGPGYQPADAAASTYGAEEYGSGGYGVIPGYEPGGPGAHGGTGYDEDTDHGRDQQAGYGEPGYAGQGYQAEGGTDFDAPGGTGAGAGFGAEPERQALGQSPDYVPTGFASGGFDGDGFDGEFDGGGGMLGEVHGGLPDPAASGMLNTAGMLGSSGLADATAFSGRAGLPAGTGFLDASGPMRALGGTGIFDSSEFPVVESRDGGNVTSVPESDVAELFGDAPPAEITSLDLPVDVPAATTSLDLPAAGGKPGRLTRPGTDRPAAKTAGRRRGRSGDRRLWIALGSVMAAAAVAIAAIILVGFKSGPGGPAHSLSAPDKLSSFVRRPALEQQMNVGQLRSDVVSMSSGQAKHVVEAVYENGTSTSGQTPQIVLFIGGNLANASPTASVKSFTQRFKGAQVTSPGGLGGEAACVNATASEPGSVAMCAWFDNDSFGEVVSPTMNASALAKTMRTIRPDVEKVVPKKQ
jgi:hypothetical protein